MKKVNEGFICINCWKNVLPANKTCRNHCNICFVCLHVDNNTPWDRDSQCGWVMYPIEYVISNWVCKILFKCVKCWKLHQNKASDDDEIILLDKLIYEYKRFLP